MPRITASIPTRDREIAEAFAEDIATNGWRDLADLANKILPILAEARGQPRTDTDQETADNLAAQFWTDLPNRRDLAGILVGLIAEARSDGAEGRGRMPARRTDEQIAKNLRLHICRDMCPRSIENCTCWDLIAAALARAREAGEVTGARKMQERAWMIAACPEVRDEEFMRRRPDDARDADQRDAGRQLAARDIRALTLTEVIPDGK